MLMLCIQDTHFKVMETHIVGYQLSILASTPVGFPNSTQFSMDLRSFQILRPFVESLYFQDIFMYLIYLFNSKSLIAYSIIVQQCTYIDTSRLALPPSVN